MTTRNFPAFVALAFVSLFSASAFGQSIVTNTNDSGAGSLRTAISTGGNIDFDPVLFSTPQTITLTTPFAASFNDFSINGPGADLLTIDGTFSNEEIFFIQSGVVNIAGVTLSGANNAPVVTDLTNGIFLRGDLTLDGVAISDFQSEGVFNQGGNLAVLNSTIANNGDVGIFVQSGTSTVNNSTIVGNGDVGIFVQSRTSTVTVNNSTIVGNGEEGIDSNGASSVNNSTIANNGDAGILAGPLGNISINSSIVANNNNGNGDLSAFGPLNLTSSLILDSDFENGVSGNIIGVDPLLGPLGNNGGSTQTLLLGAGSPAIDAGSNPLGLALDQTGANRVFGPQVDIGATEFVPASVPEPGSLGLIGAIGLAFIARRNKRAA